MSVGNVIVLGQSGVGKSTWLNETFGSSFKAEHGANAVTKEVFAYETKWRGTPIRIYDSPGCLDGEGNLNEWAKEVIRATKNESFQRLFFVINATCRCGAIDYVLLASLKACLQNFTFDEGVTVVFTKCDAEPAYFSESERSKYVMAINKKCKFEENGIRPLDPSSTIAFAQMARLAANTDAQQAANKEVINHLGNRPDGRAYTPDDLHEGLNAVAAQKTIPQMRKKRNNIQWRPLSMDAGKHIVTEVAAFMDPELEKFAKKAVKCYDAATTYVSKFNRASMKFEKVLAVDIEAGDEILGQSMKPEVVLIKNVHVNDVPMHVITFAAADGAEHSFTLSSGHYLLIWTSPSSYHLVPSRDVQIGDEVRVVDSSHASQPAYVVSIEKISVSKVVSLRTQSLTLIANGVVGSCRSEKDAGLFGHVVSMMANAVATNGAQCLQDCAWSFCESTKMDWRSPIKAVKTFYQAN